MGSSRASPRSHSEKADRLNFARMFVLLLLTSLLIVGVNGQGYGRQGFGGGGGEYSPSGFNQSPYGNDGSSYRPRGDQYGWNGGLSNPPPPPSQGGFNAPYGRGFNPQSGGSFQGSSSSWSSGSQLGSDSPARTNFGSSSSGPNTRQFNEQPAATQPQVEVAAGTNPDLTSSSSGTATQTQVEVQPSSNPQLTPGKTATDTGADIDTTGARTFKTANTENTSAGAAQPPQTNEQSGVATPITTTIDPNSDKLIPEPPVLGRRRRR